MAENLVHQSVEVEYSSDVKRFTLNFAAIENNVYSFIIELSQVGIIYVLRWLFSR